MNSTEYKVMYEAEQRHWWFIGKQLFVSQVFRFFSLSKVAILDIGSGTGGMSNFLQKYGVVACVESNHVAVKFLQKRGLRVMQSSANDIQIKKNGLFDVITIFDVLYHKYIDEEQTLREAHRLLAEGGYLVITDCAHSWLWSPHDENMMAKKRYSLEEMTHLIEKAGFTPVLKSYVFATTFPLFVIHRLLLKYKKSTYSTVLPPPIVFNILLTLLMKIESKFFSYTKYLPFGSSILLVARK